MARRPNQVSIPNPEFGVDFDASARAMHQSASKGSLMVHETAFSMPAVVRKSLAATMFERNTMLKTLKRKIALVAVAGLGFGLVSTVPANAAAAAATSVAVSPVRLTLSGGVQDTVPNAILTFVTPNAITAAGLDACTLTMVSAPSAAAEVTIYGEGQAAKGFKDSLAGNPAAVGGGVIADCITADKAAGATVTLQLALTSTVAGTYAGTLLLSDADADDVTVTWSFTTRGAVASWTVAGTATTSLVSGTDTVTVTLKDANSNTTQPLAVDSLALTNSNAGGFTDGTNTAVTATELQKGTIDLTYTAGAAAGVNTVTVTPQGTLPLVLSAQTLTYTVSGTVVATSVSALSVSTPTTALNAGDIGADDGATSDANNNNGDRVARVPAGTSALVISFTHGTASVKARWKVSGTAGTINGAAATTAQYFNVDADALGKGTLSLTLGGSAIVETQTVTVEQVKVDNSAIDPDAGGAATTTDIVITQTARSAATDTVTLSPTGNIIAKLGTATAPTQTAVKVTIADQFGDAIGAGYTVRAYRTAVADANLLATGVTVADGTVTLTVSHATTLVAAGAETYVFRAVATGVAAFTSDATVVINYTADGAITGMTTTVENAANAAMGTTNLAAAAGLVAATSQTVYPVIEIPADGTASDTAFDGIYTASTAAVTLAAGGTYNPILEPAGGATVGGGELVTLNTDTTPNNAAEYTTSEGLFLCKTTSCAWNAGLTSATISDATDVYVFGTKTGIGTVTIKSGGLTREVKIFVKNDATNFYTLTATPATASVAGGAYGTITVSVKDIFGNGVDTGAADLAVTAEGAVLLGGMAASTTTGTGAAGTATVTYIGNNTGGAGTITIDGVPTTGAWATGYTKPTGAGDPSKQAKVALTVTAAAAATNPALDTVKADVKAVSDTVATLSKAVTTIQSSVTELTSSFSAQIKSLSAAIAKISKAIAALSKKIK